MRDKGIDIFKGTLVIFMILAHVVQFIGNNGKILSLLSLYVNLTTFSGFYFTFGYVSEIAYFSKKYSAVKKRIFNAALKTLAAFYISGIFYRLLVAKQQFDLIAVAKIIFLFDIPEYSEFLISFFLIAIISILFFKLFKIMTMSQAKVLCGACLLFTFIPYELIKISQIGLFVGTQKFSAFPVIQYLPFFVVGIMFKRHNVRFNSKGVVISLLLSVTFFIYIFITKILPSRFPPSLVWILGPTFYLYVYYVITRKVANWKYLYPIARIGRNTLLYLILSNIFIFSLSNVLGKSNGGVFCLFTAILLISLIWVLMMIFKDDGSLHRIEHDAGGSPK